MLKKRLNDDILLEAGLDECGAGCLFGPVVAASVIMPPDWFNSDVKDSKKLNSKKRESLYELIIKECISYSIQEVDNITIDNINILQSRFLAMSKCVNKMNVTPEHLLIDGDKFYKNYHIPFTCIVKGDSSYLSIASASILGKVYRDMLIVDMSKDYKDYYLDKNKGYGTKDHIEAIKKFGITNLHRSTFCGHLV